MEADLRDLIADDPDVIALVATRVAWNTVGQGWADPNIVLYLVAGGAPGYVMTGEDGLTASVVQINVRARTYVSMIGVRDALTALLSGFAGTHGATEFVGIFSRSQRQDAAKTGDVLYHTCQLDFDVWSRAAATS